VRLIDEILNLRWLIVDARIKANSLAMAAGEPPAYIMLDRYMANTEYYAHPAMVRYLEIYKEHAVVLGDF
jgi:hypothetical protein